jgi:GNAT superfamily N-acetyltransferase
VKTIPVKVTYLEMLEPRRFGTPPPLEAVEIVRAREPTVGFYRFLYDAVGKDWQWVNQKLLSDGQLAEIIGDERVELHVLYVKGTPAGFAELDRRRPGEIELRHFGIVPEFSGKGLGRYFLHWAVERAWSYAPGRLWLHTCELDHPAALPLYKSTGFRVYDEVVTDQAVL